MNTFHIGKDDSLDISVGSIIGINSLTVAKLDSYKMGSNVLTDSVLTLGTSNVTDLADISSKSGSGTTVIMSSSPTIESPTITGTIDMRWTESLPTDSLETYASYSIVREDDGTPIDTVRYLSFDNGNVTITGDTAFIAGASGDR